MMNHQVLTSGTQLQTDLGTQLVIPIIGIINELTTTYIVQGLQLGMSECYQVIQLSNPATTMSMGMMMRRRRKSTSMNYSLLHLCLLATLLILHSADSAAALLDSWRVAVLHGGVCAVQMTTAHTDKVVIYDRTNAGKTQIAMPNGTCRDNPYEQVLKHDCTAHSVEYDSLTDAIRPLSIFSDPFCSSATWLPNGTLVQTGGDKEGNNTVRFIGPGPTDDWIENMNYLFVKRWYTTAQILPTGNVILVGGAFQNSYEFYPRSTAKQITLPLLQKNSNEAATWNNWYPFVHLLPDGNLFIYANVYSQVCCCCCCC